MPSIERDTGMHAPQSSDSNHTEIDLAQLFEQCWASRRSIALITALGTGAALAYALLATPIYQVDVLLRPVQTRALEALNIKGLYSITPKQALDRVSNELTAYSGRRTYFEAHPEQFEQLEFGELSPNVPSGASAWMLSPSSSRTRRKRRLEPKHSSASPCNIPKEWMA